jgi:hypothetical protein
MRWRNLFAVLAGLAVVMAAGALLTRAPDRKASENFGRVQSGMTRAEVEFILGKPGYHDSGPVELDLDFGRLFDPLTYRGDPSWRKGIESVSWLDDGGWISLEFDSSARVCGMSFTKGRRLPQTPIENLLWRVKVQWRLWFEQERTTCEFGDSDTGSSR